MSKHLSFTTPGGLDGRTAHAHSSAMLTALDGFAARLDRERGALFSSGIDYPGRYSRWEFGFVDPPLELVGRDRRMVARALNPRGAALLELLAPVLPTRRTRRWSAATSAR